MTDGKTLEQYIKAANLNKSKIANDLKMSRQNLYSLFDSVNLEADTKRRFITYFGEDIFAEKGPEPLDGKNPGPVKSQDQPLSEQSFNNLTESNKALALANQRLADAHFIIAKNNNDLLQMAKGATGKIDAKNYEVLQARLSILSEYLARIGSGFRFPSYGDAIEVLGNELVGISHHQTSQEGRNQESNKQNISQKES